MCIVLYVKHIQCSGITQIFGQIEDWVCLTLLDMSIVAICEIYLVQWYYIDLWLIDRGYI